MKFDLVHDIQKTYRSLVQAMSNPGVIVNVAQYVDKNELEFDFYDTTFALMYMLLDAEVSFKIYSAKADKTSRYFTQLTHSRPQDVKAANFIFVLSDASEDELQEAFTRSYEGDLIDPHKSATIIVETQGITAEKSLALKGPGIKDTNYLAINISERWVVARAEKNKEYPMGVDVIFVDQQGNMACLPRTTQTLQVVK